MIDCLTANHPIRLQTCFQAPLARFELVVPNSKSIIEDIIRKDTNKKKGTQEITKWFTTK